jgi:mRNA-degrading endonuclease RelE of RelBE toxin-antitoxin system
MGRFVIMKFVRTDPFKRDFQRLPETIKRRTEAALRLLLSNPHHPSLRVKKARGEVIKGYSNVFEGRITRDYRFFFLIEKDAYTLLRCGRHEEFLK